MKKAVSTTMILFAILSMLLLASCGKKSNVDLSDSKYVGTWKCMTMSLQDASENLEQSWILTLNGDGTGSFVDEDGTSNITWELTGNGFKTKGDTKLTFTDDGDNIKTKVIGVDLIFERQ
ncbi:MAG: hypothetical protein Q4D81_12695 [Eubacteriales bacterium]|nr:hypothetical protein [Eubacteriales bacterium]